MPTKASLRYLLRKSAQRRIAFQRLGEEVARVKAAEIIAQIKELPPEEFAKVSAFILGEETPEMLAAIDEGVRSLEQKGGKIQTRAELQEKVRRWAGESH